MNVSIRTAGVATCLVAALSVSCGQYDRADIAKEVSRYAHLRVIGPYQIASVVGFSSPLAGCPGFTPFLVDLSWRSRFRDSGADVPRGELPLSPFELPDPNRTVQIGHVGK